MMVISGSTRGLADEYAGDDRSRFPVSTSATWGLLWLLLVVVVVVMMRELLLLRARRGIVRSRAVSPLQPGIVTRGRQFGAFSRDELERFLEPA
jgi:hypothetical protein